MSQIAERTYLQHQQYHTTRNLDARIALHKHFSTNPYGLPRWLFDQLAVPNNGAVLEVGTGSGNIWCENADRIPAGWHMLLTDFSPGMLRQSRDVLADVLPRARFAVADAQALPLPDAAFDAVIANFMLYHVPDRNRAIAEFRRVLKPGGRLYAATNGRGHLRELHELLARFGQNVEMWSGPATSGFSLENGGEQLAAHFGQVALHRYEDAIVVGETAPVVDYIASFAPLHDEQHVALHAFVADEIACQGGALRVTKAPGVFVAQA